MGERRRYRSLEEWDPERQFTYDKGDVYLGMTDGRIVWGKPAQPFDSSIYRLGRVAPVAPTEGE